MFAVMSERAITPSVCVVSAVLVGLTGCAYPVHERASGWLMVETSHIQLRTNIRRDAAIQLANEMQYSYELLANYALPCAHRGDEDRVQVTVLPTPQFVQYAGPNVGGFYNRARVTWFADHDSQVVLPDDLGLESNQVVLHEMTHRLVEACFVRAPPWLNEGLAGFFETMLVEADRVVIGYPPYAIRTSLRVGPPTSSRGYGLRIWPVAMYALPSIESMIGLTTWQAHEWTETAPRYATAWALVHFLVIGAPDLGPRFKAYLEGLQNPASDPQRLFAKLFEDVPLQDRLNKYLLTGNLQLLKSNHPLGKRDGGWEPRVRDMREEEAHVHLAWMNARARDEQGRDRLQLHLAAAMQNPRSRDDAYLVAAYARLASGDLAGAQREVEDGLRESPDKPAFLEARLDVLLARKAGAAELRTAAERLRPLAKTSGQFCSLALAALRTGDREPARELADQGLQLDPRRIGCRFGTGASTPPR